ncbi:RecQ-like DNA helicase Blm [Acropora cervicornis]|uniref:DNA 3'-5' helicase n=1 Tax=Acropora cervicornis TaxID=6130 RepID=A0AAD9UTF6_ACRCE|nr:RecQ-like DNA helicase Blm [Acropora cervicornis]
MFYSSLHFAILTSSYNNINVKPKQVKCLEAVYNGRDLVAVLPTGYGKSMIFHLLPDQIRRISQGKLKAAALNIKRKQNSADLELDVGEASFSRLKEVPVLALTATASKNDVAQIKESLNLKNPLEVIATPNRTNVFNDKVLREGEDVDFFIELLTPIVEQLGEKTVTYPLTVLYLPLKWCGFAFKYFEKHLGDKQYFPAAVDQLPENRMFAQFHAPQTKAMKEQILKELASPTSKVRVIFATVAMGMGVDIPSIRNVIHLGPPQTVREYFQETGRAGQDGKLATATLYYNWNE